VDVTLDGTLLKLAGKFLSGTNHDEAVARKIVTNLQSVTVKSFEFSSDGQYDMADVEAIRSQVKGPQWARIVGVRSKRDGDNIDVFFKDAGNGNLGGLVVLCAGPRELTIVSIVGTLDPSELIGLGGHFGIPEMDLSIHSRKDAR